MITHPFTIHVLPFHIQTSSVNSNTSIFGSAFPPCNALQGSIHLSGVRQYGVDELLAAFPCCHEGAAFFVKFRLHLHEAVDDRFELHLKLVACSSQPHQNLRIRVHNI